MVGFVFETPLAKSHITSTLFQVLDHIAEILLFEFIEFSEGVSTCNVQVVFGLGLRGLKRTSQDGDPSISDLLGHLRMGELLINQDAFDQLCILDASSCFLLYFNQFQVDVLPFQVSHAQDASHRNLGKFILVFAHDFRSQ